jgi:hypothetical protein
MAEDDLKGDDLLKEAAKVFDTPPAGGSPTTPQSDETTGTPPGPTSSGAKPGEIKSDEDLVREANQILDK